MMATNLVSTIMQSLTPDAIARLAPALGLDKAATQKGVTAAIPGILAEFAKTASDYDGPQKLGRAISQIDSLAGRGGDTLRSLLDASKSTLGSGWNIGSSLLGGSALETLSSVVAKYAGLDLGSAKKLLSFLVPVVLGFLKREQASGALDNAGLARLLVEQKGNIERALPAGLMAAAPVGEPRPAARPTAPAAPRSGPSSTAKSAGSTASGGWATWMLPALLAALAALYFLSQREEPKTAQDTGQKTTTAAIPAPATPPAAPISAQITPASLQSDIAASIEQLRVALPKINDPASAQASVSEIRDISARIMKLKAAAQQIPADARKSVWDALSAKISELAALVERVTKEINYLSGEAKPALDTLKTELTNLPKA